MPTNLLDDTTEHLNSMSELTIPESPNLNEDEKRKRKNDREKRRRENFNDTLNKLSQVLNLHAKTEKLSIIETAINEIQRLKTENIVLQEEIKRLRNNNDYFESEFYGSPFSFEFNPSPPVTIPAPVVINGIFDIFIR